MREASFWESLTDLRASAIAVPKSLLAAPAVRPSAPGPLAAPAPPIGVPSGRRPARATAEAKSKGLSLTSIMGGSVKDRTAADGASGWHGATVATRPKERWID